MTPQKFFELIPSNTKFNFVGSFKIFFTISILLMVTSVCLVIFKGLNYGVDFRGGAQIHIKLPAGTKAQDVRKALGTIDLKDAMVQGFGEKGSGEYLIRTELTEIDPEKYKDQITKSLQTVDAATAPRLRFSEDRIYVKYDKTMDTEKIKSALQGMNLSDLRVESVTPFGKESDFEYLVQFDSVANRMVHAFETHFGKGNVELLQAEMVGPKVGKELRMQAMGAILISILLILIYVWFRFDFVFAPGAAISLLHDALVVLGAFALFGWPFDLSIVAVVLTIVGFSINDTIVVYDRVRENLKKTRDPNFEKVINQSINETLSRTFLTAGTVFIASLTLLLIGGPITYNFARAFCIGIVFGTYSSLFVALAITIYLRNYLAKKRVAV